MLQGCRLQNPARAYRYPLLLRITYKVPDYEKVGGIVHLVYDLKLCPEPVLVYFRRESPNLPSSPL